jgi:O-antigen/teichoic acid export membrane protein
MSKKVKNSFLYLLPTMAGVLIPLITLPLFTRVLSTEEYGSLALCQVYAVFTTGIANFGLTFGYERDFFEQKNNIKQIILLYSTLSFVVSLLIFFGLSTLFFSGEIVEYLKIKSTNPELLLLITFSSVAISSIRHYFLIYFKNNENAKKYVLFTLDEIIISFILSMFFVLYIRTGVIGIVLSQLIGGCLILFFLIWKFLKIKSFEVNFKMLKNSLELSAPLTPRIFFGIIGSQFDKYIIGIASSTSNVGIYHIAQKIANLGYVFMTSIQNVWGPVVYKMMFENKEKNKSLIGIYLTPFFYVSIFICLIISLFSEEIIFLMAPNEYSSGSIIITLLSILYGSFFFSKQNQLIFAKKTWLISILTLFGISLNVLINYIFVYRWGFIGVAWGTMLSGLISGFISYVYSQKSYRIKWELYTYIIFIYFVVSSLAWIFLMYFNVSYEIKIMFKLILFLGFILIGFYTKIISYQNYLLIKNLILSKI